MPQTRQLDAPNSVNRPSLRGRRVVVVGLGRFGGGVGVTRWLAGQGADVLVTDQARTEELGPSIEALADLDVHYRLGGHDVADLRGADLVVVNPAVDKRRSAFFKAIVDSGVPWTTEINLSCERCPATVVGVTGSFGKSTTAAMIAAVMEAAVAQGVVPFAAAHLGGNIGGSLLGSLSGIAPGDVVVLELSSAQLEDTPRISWVPDVAAITNIHPHHLDRYASFSDYIEAKLNILATPGRRAVGGSGSFGPMIGGNDRRSTGRQTVVVGAMAAEAEQALADRASTDVHEIIRLNRCESVPMQLAIPGAHNQINAQMAYQVTRALGVPESVVGSALAAFRGLQHRLEFVATVDGVDYFNDSKSTSPAATMVALEALADRKVVAIVGGQRKAGVSYEACVRSLIARCRAVVCTGECGPDFAAALAATGDHVDCAVIMADALPDALDAARLKAKQGDAVLFSPGAPSFDAYANYTERGQHFVRLVTSFA